MSAARISAIKTLLVALGAELAMLEGRPHNTYYGQILADAEESERKRLAEIAERAKPHAWRNPGPGVPITEVGDNDDSKDLDDLLRAFGSFCNALTRENQPDSTGVKFYVPWIKQRGGLGPQSVRLIRDEIRGKWYSDWGIAWRNHPLNQKEGLIPKPEVVDALFSKVYG